MNQIYQLIKFLNYQRRTTRMLALWKATPDDVGSMHRRERKLRKLVNHAIENQTAINQGK